MLKYFHSLNRCEAILENFIPHCKTALSATRTKNGEVDSDTRNSHSAPKLRIIIIWQIQQKERFGTVIHNYYRLHGSKPLWMIKHH